MHPCAHVASTGFIVISHALSLNIDKLVMVYYLIAYTLIDTLFIFGNIRRDSLIIHHLMTFKLLTSCVSNRNLIPLFVPLGMLEWTTFFNSLNQLLRNDITLVCRNTSWILVRMIYLPFVTYRILQTLVELDAGTGTVMGTVTGTGNAGIGDVAHQMTEHITANVTLNMTTDNIIDLSHCVLTLLILSYEWSFEILKINFKLLSSSYYVIPALYMEQSRRIEYALASSMMAMFSTFFRRYESRLIFNLGVVNIMQRFYL